MPSEQAMRAIRRNQSEHLQALTTGEGLEALVGELVETLQNFMRWSEPLAKYAGSRWAENNGLSQPCRWLNETSKEAAALLARAREMGIPAPTRDERNCDKCGGSGKVMSPAPWIDEAELITCSACDGTGIDRAMAGEKEVKDAGIVEG